MPTIDLRDTALRSAVGLSNGAVTETVPIQFQWRKPKRQYRDRAETRVAVLDVLKAAPCPMSRREIARALDREKSPGIIGVIRELVADGAVVEIESSWRGALMYLYEVVR